MFPFPRWESTTHCCSLETRTVAPMFPPRLLVASFLSVKTVKTEKTVKTPMSPPLLLVASLLSVKTTLALVSCKSSSPTYILILLKTIEINFT